MGEFFTTVSPTNSSSPRTPASEQIWPYPLDISHLYPKLAPEQVLNGSPFPNPLLRPEETADADMLPLAD